MTTDETAPSAEPSDLALGRAFAAAVSGLVADAQRLHTHASKATERDIACVMAARAAVQAILQHMRGRLPEAGQ